MGVFASLASVVAGQRLTATYANQVKTYLDSLNNVDSCSAYRSVTGTMPNNTYMLLTMDNEDYDRNGMHNSTNQSRVSVQTDGRYQIRAQAQWQANGTGYRSIMVRKNSGGSVTGGSYCWLDNRSVATSGDVSQAGGTFTQLVVTGDYFEAFVFQNSGGGLLLDTSGFHRNSLEITYMGNT